MCESTINSTVWFGVKLHERGFATSGREVEGSLCEKMPNLGIKSIQSCVGAAFQMIYNKTLDTFPGAYLLGTSGLALAAIPTNMIMYKLLKTFKKTEAMENKIEESRL